MPRYVTLLVRYAAETQRQVRVLRFDRGGRKEIDNVTRVVCFFVL